MLLRHSSHPYRIRIISYCINIGVGMSVGVAHFDVFFTLPFRARFGPFIPSDIGARLSRFWDFGLGD